MFLALTFCNCFGCCCSNHVNVLNFTCRKQVDPETTKYFSEIANLFESSGVDLEDRSVICGNALEEARGKEFELATDYYISHTLQTLLEGCSVDQLCGFLRGCANVFPFISMDRSGSHVAETALKSLAMHLQDSEVYSVIEDTLTAICKVFLYILITRFVLDSHIWQQDSPVFLLFINIVTFALFVVWLLQL